MSLSIKICPSKGPYNAGLIDGYGRWFPFHLVAHIIIGYYNPLLAYGEETAVKDAKEAGANGFIMVDLPPEEAIRFRELCTSHGYVPGFPFTCVFTANISADYHTSH